MPCCSQNPEDRFSPYKIYNIKNDARKPVLGGGGGVTPTFTGVYLIFTIKHRLCTALKHTFTGAIYVLSKNKKSTIFFIENYPEEV